jgi:hypothetical protein
MFVVWLAMPMSSLIDGARWNLEAFRQFHFFWKPPKVRLNFLCITSIIQFDASQPPETRISTSDLHHICKLRVFWFIELPPLTRQPKSISLLPFLVEKLLDFRFYESSSLIESIANWITWITENSEPGHQTILMKCWKSLQADLMLFVVGWCNGKCLWRCLRVKCCLAAVFETSSALRQTTNETTKHGNWNLPLLIRNSSP